MVFNFNPITILNWSAYLSKTSASLQDKTCAAMLSNNTHLDTSLIPPMHRRRCSQASKIALSLAIQATANSSIDRAVFCSQHAELTNTLALLDQIQKKEILSPQRFSQSVHNSAAGLFSILQNLTIPITSIAAKESTFLAGVIESITWLHLNPNKNLLLVMFDEDIPSFYKTLNLSYQDEYGVALLLSNQQTGLAKLQVQLQPITNLSAKALPPALAFLSWYLADPKQPLLQVMDKQTLQWTRYA